MVMGFSQHGGAKGSSWKGGGATSLINTPGQESESTTLFHAEAALLLRKCGWRMA